MQYEERTTDSVEMNAAGNVADTGADEKSEEGN